MGIGSLVLSFLALIFAPIIAILCFFGRLLGLSTKKKSIDEVERCSVCGLAISPDDVVDNQNSPVFCMGAHTHAKEHEA